jgi:Zn-dependent M16 (insulinase) family peptidase
LVLSFPFPTCIRSHRLSSTYIVFDASDRASLADLCIYVGSVPTELLDTFDDRLRDSLKRIVSQGIDMDRMSKVINRDERQVNSSCHLLPLSLKCHFQFRNRLESAKGDEFSSTIISDVLYGPDDGSELEASMDDMNLYAEVRKWTSAQWANLLEKCVVHSPFPCMR